MKDKKATADTQIHHIEFDAGLARTKHSYPVHVQSPREPHSLIDRLEQDSKHWVPFAHMQYAGQVAGDTNATHGCTHCCFEIVHSWPDAQAAFPHAQG